MAVLEIIRKPNNTMKEENRVLNKIVTVVVELQWSWNCKGLKSIRFRESELHNLITIYNYVVPSAISLPQLLESQPVIVWTLRPFKGFIRITESWNVWLEGVVISRIHLRTEFLRRQ